MAELRLAGLARASYCNSAKLAINRWLSEVVTVSISGELWCLLLETKELQTVKALKNSGGKILAERVLAPNPSEEECAAMRLAAPGIHALPCTSHTLLAELLTDVPPKIPGLADFTELWEKGFDFVWLDYCGTLMSSPGHRRQTDISLLFSGPFLRRSAVLAVTLSERGAARLYRGELANSLIVCVQAAAMRAQRKVTVVGLAEYRAPTPMVTAAFLLDEEVPNTLQSLPADVEGVRFRAWHAGYGLEEFTELPLAKAMSTIADAFARAAGGSKLALVVESVKLLPVTRSLERLGACDGPILSSLADPLEALMAKELLGREVEVLCGAKLMEHLNKLSDSDSKLAFDAVWLGYDSGRAMTSTLLHSSSEWSHLNTLLSLKLLSSTALLAVSIAYVNTAEVWLDSAVDWTLEGLTKACRRYGYWITAASVMKFTANNARLVLVMRLGQEEDAEKAATTPALSPLQSEELVEYHEVWDPCRTKKLSGEARRFKRLAPLLSLLQAQRSLLHEPGFLVLAPKLKEVICCTYDDPVVHKELLRQGLATVELPVDQEVLRSCRALVLLDDCGAVSWGQRWKDLAMRWIEEHKDQTFAIVLICFDLG